MALAVADAAVFRLRFDVRAGSGWSGREEATTEVEAEGAEGDTEVRTRSDSRGSMSDVDVVNEGVDVGTTV